MAVLKSRDINDLKAFKSSQNQLCIVERKSPDGSESFFQKLMNKPLLVMALIRKDYAFADLKEVLQPEISAAILDDLFYDTWLKDMAGNIEKFCEVMEVENLAFWLGSKRGCRRYHVDKVPMRMLVTYAGKGTEWVPDEAVDRKAYEKGAKNDEIILDGSMREFMQPWDVALFYGGDDGILHRTPDDAFEHSSILMRLDHPSFWYDVLEPQLSEMKVVDKVKDVA
ncbi:DUF1826 domain-containing protein [Curvivirga sp.]|uniref:DUF1826 domain-containing protein n=1 Tax=Curvivirga sp. TaxID=2856848 RepID=UPI003B5B3078